MNTIEIANGPVKDKPAAEGPPLRVFIKDSNAYTLQYETRDFQKAIEYANKQFYKGKDILVNEKENPTIVHAKSNRAMDVDVGREIKPKELDGGRYARGPGEVILASFYQKLPMETKEFDERNRPSKDNQVQSPGEPITAAAQEPRPAAGGQATSVVAEPTQKMGKYTTFAKLALGAQFADDNGDKWEKTSANSGKLIEAVKHGQNFKLEGKTELFQPSAEVDIIETGKPQPRLHSDDAPADVGAKPSKAILSKSGYAIPDHVLVTYVIRNGKFHHRDSNALLFEDHGKKLATSLEDRKVIADMIAVAGAKNWGQLELKGTDAFRQMAWLEAEARGIETIGYKPNDKDLERLDAIKREQIIAGTPARDAALKNSVELEDSRASKATMSPSPQAMRAAEHQPEPPAASSTVSKHTMEHEAAKHIPSPEGRTKTPVKQKAVSVNDKSVLDVEQAAVSSQTKHAVVQQPEPPATSSTVSGRVLEHGPAKFNFDPDEKKNYFVKLETANGERIIWGKDLSRAMKESKTKVGDHVELEYKGSKSVVVDANVRDDQGKVIGVEEIATHRNKWEVKPATLAVTRALSPDEKLRVDVAAKILDKELAKYPENVRREVLAKVTAAIDKGDVNLPSPKVSERGREQSRPARTQGMER